MNATAGTEGRRTTDMAGKPVPTQSNVCTSTSDRLHANFRRHLLAALPGLDVGLSAKPMRDMTFQQSAPDALVHHSQIDDIWTWTPSAQSTETRGTTHIAPPVDSIHTDHMPVEATIPDAAIRLPRLHDSVVVSSPRTRWKWNQTKMNDPDALRRLKLDLAAQTDEAAQALLADMQQSTQHSAEAIDKFAADLVVVLQDSLEVCRARLASKVNAKPTRFHTRRSRKELRRLRKALNAVASVSVQTPPQINSGADTDHKEDTSSVQHLELILNTLAAHSSAPSTDNRTSAEEEDTEDTDSAPGPDAATPRHNDSDTTQPEAADKTPHELLDKIASTSKAVCAAHHINQVRQQLGHEAPGNEGTTFTAHVTLQHAQATLRCLHKRRLRKEAKSQSAEYRKFINRLKLNKPKLAHKIIYGKHTQQPLEALEQTNGTITYDPQQLSDLTHQFFEQRWSAPSGAPIGTLPPWHNPQLSKDLSPEETTQFNPTQTPRVPSLEQYASRLDNFERTLTTLSKGKEPGPDAIPNELLRVLPPKLRQVIHQLFIHMWASAHTPAAWKTSTTILLYKKRSPTDLSNYRPIGLCNTLYKLWTSHINTALTAYLEEFKLLHNGQEGFRRRRNTKRQIHQLQLLYANARNRGKAVAVQFVDFSSAFNTVSHEHMMTAMRIVGIPDDAIAVIADLYKGTTTRILNREPYFTTEDINVRQGVIQGDSLSPTVFTICMDPMSRWLEAGQRGFDTGIKHPDTQDPLVISSLAYADDLTMPTGHVPNMRKQNIKLSLYAEWMGLQVNAGKCEATYVDWHETSPLAKSSIDMYRRRIAGENPLVINAASPEPIPFVAPGDPVTYLGALIPATLHGAPQMQAITAKLKAELPKLARSGLRPTLQCSTLEQTLLQAIKYPIALVTFELKEIEQVNKTLRGFFKRCWRLPPGTPTDVLHAPKTTLGMEVPDFLPLLAQQAMSEWRQSMLDTGSLGALARSQLVWELQRCSGFLPNKSTWPAYSEMPMMRLIGLMHDSGIHIPDAADVVGNPIMQPHASWLQDLCALASDADLEYPATKIAEWILLCQRSSIPLRAMIRAARTTQQAQVLQPLNCNNKTTPKPARLALSNLHALLRGHSWKAVQNAQPNAHAKLNLRTQVAITSVPDKIGRMWQHWAHLPAVPTVQRRLEFSPQQALWRDSSTNVDAVNITHAPSEMVTTTQDTRARDGIAAAPPAKGGWHPPKRPRKMKRKDKEIAYLEAHQRVPRDPSGIGTDYGVYSLAKVQERLRTIHQQARRECPPPHREVGRTLIYSKEQYEYVDEIASISELSEFNHKRLRKGIQSIQEPHEEYHLQGVLCTTQWAPVVVVQKHVEPLRQYWAQTKYHVEHVHTIDYPRTEQERDTIRALLAQQLIEPSDRFCMLHFAPTKEPLCQLLFPESSDDSPDAIDFARLYKLLDGTCLEAALSTQISRPKPAPTPVTRNCPNQMAFESSTRTDWELSALSTTGNALIDYLHFPNESSHPGRDIDPSAIDGNIAHLGPLIPLTSQGSKDSLWLYGSTGRFIADVPAVWYSSAWECAAQHGKATKAAPFHSDLLRLLGAYGLNYESTKPRPTSTQVPSMLVHSLLEAFPVNKLYNSTPFLWHDAHSNVIHHSEDPSAQAFGLAGGMWSHTWHQALILAPLTSAEAFRAFRWALCSVDQAQESSISLVVTLGNNANIAVSPYFDHRHVSRICTFSYTQAPTLSSPSAKTPTGTVWLIANHAAAQVADRGRDIFQQLVSNANWKYACGAAEHKIVRLHTARVTPYAHRSPHAPPLQLPKRLQRVLASPAPADHIPSIGSRWNGSRSEIQMPSPRRLPGAFMIDHALAGTGVFGAYGPHACFFTDGSTKLVDTGNERTTRTGAAFVECHRGDMDLDDPEQQPLLYSGTMVLPSTKGVFHENYRAELVAILACLDHKGCEQRNVVVYTDSKASINSISNKLRHTSDSSQQLHAQVLEAIAARLLDRAKSGLHTHLVKVKSHVGITGNEWADKVANAAANLPAAPSVDVHRMLTSDEPLDYTQQHTHLPPLWPHVPIRRGHAANDGEPRLRAARHRKDALQTFIESRSHTAHAKTTLYYQGLLNDRSHLDEKSTGLAWTTATDQQMRTVILTRTGQLFNRKLLSLYTKGQESSACPLCGHQSDSVSHIVTAECKHRQMRSLAIQRHNLAVAAVTKAFIKSGRSRDATITVDLGEQHTASLPTAQIHNETVLRRLPADLRDTLYAALLRKVRSGAHELGDILASTEHYPELNTLQNRVDNLPRARALAYLQGEISLNPDILITLPSGQHNHTRDKADAEQCAVILAEVGYCREGFAVAKTLAKESQHRLLRYLLRESHPATDNRAPYKYVTMTLGVTGAIYSDAVQAMHAMHLPHAAQQALKQKLVHIAVNYTHGMVVKRRQLEAATGRVGPTQTRKPPNG